MITPAEKRIELALEKLSGYGPRVGHLRLYLRGYPEVAKILNELEAQLDDATDLLENGI